MTVDERDIVEARAEVERWLDREHHRIPSSHFGLAVATVFYAERKAAAEILRLRAEVAALQSDVTDLVQAASDEATAFEALRSEALEVVGPFAEAKSCLDNAFPDHGEIWETSAAMMIEARHLRNAAKFLAKHGDTK